MSQIYLTINISDQSIKIKVLNPTRNSFMQIRLTKYIKLIAYHHPFVALSWEEIRCLRNSLFKKKKKSTKRKNDNL